MINTFDLSRVCVFAFPLGEKSRLSPRGFGKFTWQKVHVKCMWQRSMSSVYGKDQCQVYVAKVCIKCMWQRSMSNVYGKDPCQVYVATVHVKYMWQRSTSSVCGKGLCQMYVTGMRVKCIWQSSTSDVCGKGLCKVYMQMSTSSVYAQVHFKCIW